MKNNIRYKGNINNTSVIIFFNWRTKAPCDVTLLGRTSSEVFVMLVVVLHFIFDLHFVAVPSFVVLHFCIFMSFLILILLLLFICRCSSFTFSFRHHPSPFRGLSPGFYTHFIISAQPIAEWFAALSFSTIPLSSCREHYGFEWAFFYTQAFFTLCSFIEILPAFVKVYLGAGSSSLRCAGLHTDPENRPICLFDSQ